MKNTLLMLALVAIASFLTACGGTANTNAPAANANANAAKPAAPATPTAESLLELDKKASEAYTKGDAAFFETFLSDKTIMAMGKERMGKAATVAMIKTAKCEVKDGIKLSEPKLLKVNDDTYVLTYKDETAGSCTENGKTMPMNPTRASTLYVRSGDKWLAAWHGGVDIMAPAGDAKKDEAASADAKKDAAKKDEPAAAKKDEAKPANANTAAPAEPAKLTPSPNTDALTKTHLAGWEAFKNKDAKYFESTLASSFAFVDPAGGYSADKAAVIKEWTGAGTMKCEGITKVSFGDSFAWSLSPTVEILLGKGTADGKCDGHPNGDLWQTAVYVKEGEAWKLAFMEERMPSK